MYFTINSCFFNVRNIIQMPDFKCEKRRNFESFILYLKSVLGSRHFGRETTNLMINYRLEVTLKRYEDAKLRLFPDTEHQL